MIRKTLSLIEFFGICIFDNSQMIRLLKFQRSSVSSEVSLAISRIFLEAMIPIFIHILQWPEEKVCLTYVNQSIPLPPNIPKCELIDYITLSVFQESTIFSTTMDISGDRVNS